MTARPPDKPEPLSNGTVSAHALALVGLSVCEAAARPHSWSLTLLLLAFITGLLAPLSIGGISMVFPLLIVSLALAGCQSYLAWRLAFDRQVFATWARLRDDECGQAQRTFDTVLGTLLKKSVPANASRPMLDRVMGTRRLHLLQIAALLGQMLTLLVLMAGLLWGSNHA
ncbi:MAG: hypothetical protein FWD67_10000 [Betaproteobacteria bacterium]|nr:hypothetical protein [Betaproteobacteria bacterium]